MINKTRTKHGNAHCSTTVLTRSQPSKHGSPDCNRYRLGNSSDVLRSAALSPNPNHHAPHCAQTGVQEMGRVTSRRVGSEVSWSTTESPAAGIQQTGPERGNHAVGGSTSRRSDSSVAASVGGCSQSQTAIVRSSGYSGWYLKVYASQTHPRC